MSLKNRILEALPPEETARLAPHMTHLDLERGRMLYEAGDPIDYVYFPLTGVISLMTLLENGGAIECGMVGPEGGHGLVAALGPRTALVRAVVQTPTRAVRLSAAVLQEVWPHRPFLSRIVHAHSEALYAHAAQSVACNAMHTVEERICRWLLACDDRVAGRTLQLTQEYLADMLGVQRTTVTAVARGLQLRGAIRYRRGNIEILDRAVLEAAACECYGVVSRTYARLRPAPVTPLEETAGTL